MTLFQALRSFYKLGESTAAEMINNSFSCLTPANIENQKMFYSQN